MKKQVFTFRIYQPIKAVFVLMLSLILAVMLLIKLKVFIELPHAVLTLLLLLFILGILALAKNLITTHLTVEMDNIGLVFKDNKSFLGIKEQRDRIILWNDLIEWFYEEGQLTAHAWSPDIFSLKYLRTKKARFFIVIGQQNKFDFEIFFNYFLAEVDSRNIKNLVVIKEKDRTLKSKIMAIIMVPIWIATPCGLIWFFLYKQPPQPDERLLAYILLPLSVFVGFGLSYVAIKEAFLKHRKG